MDWVRSLGVREDRLRFHQHGPDELAHYAKTAFDIEYHFPFGWQELEGIHNRTDFDLNAHQEHTGKKLEYFDTASGDRFVPYVIETSAGLNRTLLILLADAYHEEDVGGETRVVLRLLPSLAPIKAAVFPLVKKDGMPEIGRRIAADLRGRLNVFYDETGSIGRRYRRQDEAGTPFCITIDGQTLEDETVTVRDRDTLAQERVPIEGLEAYLLDAVRRAPGDARPG
jgi:glycyl-tRNA synthetase